VLFAARRTPATLALVGCALAFLSTLVVGLVGALSFFALLAASWLLLNPAQLAAVLPSSRGWGSGPRTAATAAGWAALAYDTVAMFACVASEVTRRPGPFAAAKALGYWWAALLAVAGSVAAVAGLWYLVGMGWDVVMEREQEGEKARLGRWWVGPANASAASVSAAPTLPRLLPRNRGWLPCRTQ
jgi:hypothetical protein